MLGPLHESQGFMLESEALPQTLQLQTLPKHDVTTRTKQNKTMLKTMPITYVVV